MTKIFKIVLCLAVACWAVLIGPPSSAQAMAAMSGSNFQAGAQSGVESGKPTAGETPGSPSITLQSSHAKAGAPPAAAPITGVVFETMNSGGYTYALLAFAKEKVWVAGPQVPLRVSDTATAQNPMLMRNFASKSLNRAFDAIYFASAIVPSTAVSMPGRERGKAGSMGRTVVPAQPIFGVSKLTDGYTIGELFAKKDLLAGKQVKLRAQVVKISRGILGKNWMHVQDGTGSDKQNDLTLSTQGNAEKGDLVIVSGILSKDKDIGMGYNYELIIEDAVVTVEKTAKP